MSHTSPVASLELVQPLSSSAAGILSEAAAEFLSQLHQQFEATRQEVLAARVARQKRFDAGERPDFLPETAHIRSGTWQCAPVPPDLQDRRVEITGPVDRKMVINALNSGAKVFMADFEDSTSPSFENLLDGQRNLYDAVRGTISYQSPEGKAYTLSATPATLFVRPRGWHLPERHVRYGGAPISGSLFDFGLFAFHNATELVAHGTRPYFYLPKLESHQEARLWNAVFAYTEAYLRLPVGTLRATVLIETITAAFEMEEILYELREHSVGLNCGRWDYIFSYIKKFGRQPWALLPDRAEVTMTTPFLRAYSRLAIQTCHKRGTFAMGGMAAQIPIKNDPTANAAALAKVVVDKEREATDGHDGTWVAHPGLVPVAREVFDRIMPTPNQIAKQLPELRVTANDLLAAPSGQITEAGLRTNLDVALQYCEAWLRGTGCVPIYNLMEDAATAEISRSQVWQWLNTPGARLSDGRLVDEGLVRALKADEMNKLRARVGDAAYQAGQFEHASALLDELLFSDQFVEFLTLPAYQRLA